jgi:hypothetical protein
MISRVASATIRCLALAARLGVCLVLLFPAVSLAADAAALPVRGLHVSAPRAEELPISVKFIREALAKEGVNTLVLEFGYRYQFTRRPEVADKDGLSRDDVKALLAACRQAGIRLIPQINLLGHQSWSKNTGALLRAHPEFDETPGKYPDNEGIYCRSYCPLHPQVHEVVFDLIDELAEACEADAFHVGMDEVFLIGEDDCPRCKGKNKAELFAQEVRTLRDHLARSNRTLWMWGDRLLDGGVTGIGKWEASQNGTHPAVRLIPKDVVICDWHYERAVPTATWFALEGFQVVSAPWRKAGVALAQLEQIRDARRNATPAVAARLLGMLQTTWTGGLGAIARTYYLEGTVNPRALEAVACFRALFEELRNGGLR